MFVFLAWAPAANATTVTCAGLQTAVNSAGPGDVLQLPPGDCLTNVTIGSTAAFTLEGDPAGTTVLKPLDPTNSIIQSSLDVHVTLTGLTFTGTTSAIAVFFGGAGEAVTVTHNTFKNNAVPSGFGAGLSIQPSGDTATAPTVVTGNAFTGNAASGGAGMAVLGPRKLVVSGNTFTGNTSSENGGALTIGNGTATTDQVQVDHNQFVGNTAVRVGGAMEVELKHDQSISLSSNSFQGNKITGNHTGTDERLGGAIFFGLASHDTTYGVTQANNSFSGNLIDETQAAPSPLRPAGGGAEWMNGVTVLSTGDSFVGNRVAVNDGLPPEGGAVGAFASAVSTPTPPQPGVFAGTNDLFSGNSTAAGGWGGAIYVGGPPQPCTGTCPPSSVTLNSSTVVGNSVDPGAGSEGGAIWGSPGDSLAIFNSIVSGNSPQPELFGFGANAPIVGFSDVCTEPGGPAVPTDAGNICSNPLLTPSGTETGSSPTLDAGSNALLPPGLTVDIAGNPRIAANRLGCSGPEPPITDMGAFEFVGPGVAPPCVPRPPRAVKIAGGRLTLRHGKVAIKLTCPPAGVACAGTLALTTRKAFASAAAKRHKKRKIALGHTRFRIASGKHKTVQVKVSRRALRRLKGRRSVAALVKVNTKDDTGAKVSLNHATTLVLKPKRKR
jgi:hypothetical protein